MTVDTFKNARSWKSTVQLYLSLVGLMSGELSIGKRPFQLFGRFLADGRLLFSSLIYKLVLAFAI